MWKTSRSSCQLPPGHGLVPAGPWEEAEHRCLTPILHPNSCILTYTLFSPSPLCCPFLAALLLFSPLTWGKMLPAHLPFHKHHSSPFWSSWWKPGRERRSRPCVTLIFWYTMLQAPTQPFKPWPFLTLHSPPWLLHAHPALERFTRELQSLVSPFWEAQGSLWAPLLNSTWIHSLIHYHAPNKRPETGMGGNPWRRKGMEKQNCSFGTSRGGLQRCCWGSSGSFLARDGGMLEGF